MADPNDLPLKPTYCAADALAEPAIVLTPEARGVEIKHHMYGLLPKFYGMPNEDVMTYLRDVNAFVRHVNKPDKVSDDDLKLKVVAMGLNDRAKMWVNTLPSKTLDTWDKFYEKFMERYFPHSKTQALKAQISNFRQLFDESLFEAWERFRGLLAQCPHHKLLKEDWIMIFFNGLDRSDQNWISASIGGNLFRATPNNIEATVENLARISQDHHYSDRTNRAPRVETNVASYEDDRFEKFSNEMRATVKLNMGTPYTQNLEVCGICKNYGHIAPMCRSQLAMAGKDVFGAQQNGPSTVGKAKPEGTSSLADLDNKLNFIIAQMERNQNTTIQRLTDLENDRKELHKRMQEILEKHSVREPGKLPGNSGQAMAITIVTDKVEITLPNGEISSNIPRLIQEHLSPRVVETKIQEEEDIELLGAELNKVNIKELDEDVDACKTFINEEFSAQDNLNSFDVMIGVGKLDDVVATLDTGASCNVIPLNLYERCGLSGMKVSKSIVQLADGSIMRPVGFVEDLPIRIDGVEVKADFVVMPSSKFDMKDVVLLGRSCLVKLQIVIDVFRRIALFDINDERHYLKALGSYGLKHPYYVAGFLGMVYLRTNCKGKHRLLHKPLGKSSTQHRNPNH